MIPRSIFSSEHQDFRKTVRRFYDSEVMLNIEKYEAQQHVDRELCHKAGDMGLLCVTIPEEYGGQGVDRLFSVVLMEEAAHAGYFSTAGMPVHSDKHVMASTLRSWTSRSLA